MTLLELALSHQGKPYLNGWQDCFTSVKELYKAYANLDLVDYARPDDWFMAPEFNFFEELASVEGFVDATDNPNDIRVGDLLFFKMGRTTKDNHIAIYVGGNKIFHHLTDQNSIVVEYDHTWRRRVSRVTRHPVITKHIENAAPPIIRHLPAKIRTKLQGFV